MYNLPSIVANCWTLIFPWIIIPFVISLLKVFYLLWFILPPTTTAINYLTLLPKSTRPEWCFNLVHVVCEMLCESVPAITKLGHNLSLKLRCSWWIASSLICYDLVAEMYLIVDKHKVINDKTSIRHILYFDTILFLLP